jgi:hypothetical protein
MKTKSNLLLILSITLFVILIIGKPLVVATKNYFINTTTTCELIFGSSEYYKSIVPVTTVPVTTAETIPKRPQRGSGSNLPLPCGLGGIQDIDYQYNDTYKLNIFNTLKALSLSLIALALFIRYKQRI